MRKILLSLALLAGFVSQASAADNYQATQGSGTTFAAKDNGSAVLFPRFIGCDNTTTTQCWAVDSSGRLSALATVNTWAGGTLGAMAAYGTSPGAVLVPGVNAFVTNTLTALTPGDAITTGTYASGSPTLGAMLLWNGTTYDRWKSSGTGFAAVNPGTAANWGIAATAAAVPANAVYMGFNSGGNLTGASAAAPLPTRAGDGTRQAVLNACEANAQSYANGVITSATTTRIITPSASNKTYICSMLLTASAADNVGIVEGTGGTCGTGTAGVVGGTTAANGPNFTANGGLMMQAGGKTSVAETAGTNVDFCLITSSAGPLTYSIKYVQAP